MGLGGFAAGFAKGLAGTIHEAESQKRQLEGRQKALATEMLLKHGLENPGVSDTPEFQSMLGDQFGKQAPAIQQLFQAAKATQPPTVEALLGPGGAAPTQVEGAPAAPAAPAQPVVRPADSSRIAQIQATIPEGVTVPIKTRTGTVSVTGRKRKGLDEAASWQKFQQLRGGGIGDVEAAEAVAADARAKGLSVPKKLEQLAGAKTDRALAAARVGAETAAREITSRNIALRMPKTAEEFHAAAASGLRSGYVLGRAPKDNDLLAAKNAGNVLQTLADGTVVAVPRAEATATGPEARFQEPELLLADRAARKIKAQPKSTSQTQNAALVKTAVKSIFDTGALDLLAPAGKGLVGVVGSELRGQTQVRSNLFTLRRQGDQRAIALAALKPLATSFVKAMGDTGAITESDKAAFMEFLGRVASGTATKQEAETRLNQLVGLLDHVSTGEQATPAITNATETAGASQPVTPPSDVGTYTTTPGGLQYRIIE